MADPADRTLGAPVDVLVVAAHPPELSGLAPLLGDRFAANVAAMRVVARPVGIGLAAAAGGITGCLERLRPRAVLLVGTCGAYPEQGVNVGEVAVARQVHLLSAVVVEGRAAFPAPMARTLTPHAAMTDAFVRLGATPAVVGTTLAITTDDALAERLGKDAACELEHLEAFAVALGAANYAVPFAAVLGVANRVGGTAREEWVRNHLRTGEVATALVARWLESGAPGVPRPVSNPG